MLFPIIKVKDGEYVRIVGANSHDLLYVDEETGGLQYLNLQCSEGTKKYEQEQMDEEDEYSMNFVGKQNEWHPYPVVEMVTIEELIEIAIKYMVEQTNNQLAHHKMLEESMNKYFEAKSECKEKLKDDNIKDSSGRLIF